MSATKNLALWIFLLTVFTLASGCGTATQRLASDQLLMSDAVDKAINQIDFTPLQDRKVFLETTYLSSVKGAGLINIGYLTSSLRQQLTMARCLVQDDRESAEIIVEPRIGALGTDGLEVTYGIPQTAALSSATAAFTNTPLMPAIPEISFGKSDSHSGIAKIIVFAFDKESKQPVWQSGIARAESDCNHTWVLGIGPFEKGSIHDDVRFVGKNLHRQPKTVQNIEQEKLNFASEHVFQPSRPAIEETIANISEAENPEAVIAETKVDPNVKQAGHEEN